jgi:SET domain-containing protein
MQYKALRDIEAGEEITVNYNGDPDSREPVEFSAI